MADFHHIPIDAALQASSPKKCKMHGLILSPDSMLHRFHFHSWSPQAFPGKKLLCCPPAPDTQLTPLPYLLSTAHPTAMHKASPATLATAPTDSAHPVMSGVLFDITQKDETNNEDANVSIGASDGRKLEYTRWANENNVQAGKYVLSNKQALLHRSLHEREIGEITMRFAKEKAEVRMNTFSMTCRLIDGKFPAYNKVVPKNNPNRLTVNRMAFINMLRRVLVFSDAVCSLVKLHMEADKLVTSVQNIDYSLSAEESMICEYDGMPMNIGFKGTTLVDFLNNIECENIEFQIADQSRAVIIVPSPQPNAVKDDDGNAKSKEEIVMLLMPSIIND